MIMRQEVEVWRMVATERRLSKGPADSQLVRSLFYLADGMMAGAVLYYGVSNVFFLFSGLELWMIAILLIFLAIATLHGWAWLMGARSHVSRSETAQSRISREWKETRRWNWVAVVALPVATVLVSVTVLRWGWEFGWFLPESNLLMVGSLGFGLVLRLLVRQIIAREDGPVFLPGTHRGVAGFLVLLLGLVAVLAWGGVSMDVLLLVVVAIGGYGLLYVLAAAGVK